MAEKFSPELIQAQEEALEIQKRAEEAKKREGEIDGLSGEDYAHAEKAFEYEKTRVNNKEEIPTFKNILKLNGEEREKLVEDLINKFEKEWPELEQKHYGDGPKLFRETLRSIYDKEIENGLILDILHRSGFESLQEYIFKDKPDVVFLLKRSAVPAGVVYKAFIDGLQDKAKATGEKDVIEEAGQLPDPRFILTEEMAPKDCNEDYSNSPKYKNAVKSYEKKLAEFRSAERKDQKLKIRVFDESISTGLGLEWQTKSINEACKNIGLDAEVLAFDYPYLGGYHAGSPPKIPLAYSGLPRGTKKQAEKIAEGYSAGYYKWKNLYEQQAMRLAKKAGRIYFELYEVSIWNKQKKQFDYTRGTIKQFLENVKSGGAINFSGDQLFDEQGESVIRKFLKDEDSLS